MCGSALPGGMPAAIGTKLSRPHLISWIPIFSTTAHSDQRKDLTMTSKIESTKREMYRALAALKAGGRWLLKKANAEAFESALEEHLEEVRRQILFAEEAHKYNQVLWDSYHRQQKLTQDACCRERQLTDHLAEETRLRVMADKDCGQAQQIVDDQKDLISQQKELIAAQRQEIAKLFMTNQILVRQVETLAYEADLLKIANKVAGEELRLGGLNVVVDANVPEGATALINANGRVDGFWRPM
jgi:hypothetical protein